MFCFILSGLPSHLSTNLSCICILLINFLAVFRLSGSDEVTLKNYMGCFFIFLLFLLLQWIYFFSFFLEKAMATHSSTLAWEIPWMEEPGGLESMGSWGVGHDWVTSLSFFTFMHWRRKWQPTPVFLPGESQGWRSLVGCCLGSHRVGHDWRHLAAAAAAAFFLVKATFMNYKFYIV